MAASKDDTLMETLRNFGIATAAGVGIGVLVYFARRQADKAAEEKAANDPKTGWIQTSFSTERSKIIDYVLAQDWNYFPKKVIQRIWWYFCSHLEEGKKERGIIPQAKFLELMRDDGIEDHKQFNRIYKFCSRDKQLGFSEVCRTLNLICNYPLTDILDAFFDIFDTTGDGNLDVTEMKHLYITFFGLDNQAATAHVREVMASHNLEHNATFNELSRQDFSRLALGRQNDPLADPRRGPFVVSFLKQFGLTPENIVS